MEQTGGQAPPPGAEHPEVLHNENPNFLSEGFTTVTTFMQSYGWFLLFGVICLVYLKSKLSPVLEKAQQKMEQRRENASYNPEVAMKRQDAMDAARRRLQEQHDAQAARFAEEQKQKEEEKRKEKIEDWERHQRGAGYRNKYRPPEDGASTSSSNDQNKPKGKNVYRSNDYNPLAGGGGGACFRPARRGGGGGGG